MQNQEDGLCGGFFRTVSRLGFGRGGEGRGGEDGLFVLRCVCVYGVEGMIVVDSSGINYQLCLLFTPYNSDPPWGSGEIY